MLQEDSNAYSHSCQLLGGTGHGHGARKLKSMAMQNPLLVEAAENL